MIRVQSSLNVVRVGFVGDTMQLLSTAVVRGSEEPRARETPIRKV